MCMMNTCQHALARMCMCCVCANVLHVLCECVLVYMCIGMQMFFMWSVLVYMCIGMPMFFMWCVLSYQHKRKKPRCKRLSARLSVIHRGAMVLHSTQPPPLCRLPWTPARLVTTACSESSLEPHPSSQQQDESFASLQELVSDLIARERLSHSFTTGWP